jgi:phage terminase large subunit-like protein
MVVLCALAAHAEHHPGFIGIESVAYQMTLVQICQRRGLPVREMKPEKDKLSRELTAATHYYQGRVYHRKYASWRDVFDLELIQFPQAEHDDCADVAGYAGYVLEQMSQGMRITVVDETGPDAAYTPPSVFYDLPGW